MKLHSYLFVAIILLFLNGCSSGPRINVNVDHTEDKDFSNYQYYRWYADIHPTTQHSQMSNNDSYKRNRQSIDDVLAQKGFMLAQSSSTKFDFIVNFSVSVNEHKKIDNFHNYNSQGGAFGSVSAGTHGNSIMLGYSSGEKKDRTYRDGTMVIDIIDASDQLVVWRGIADGRLPQSLGLSDKKKLAHEAVQDILQYFPPQ